MSTDLAIPASAELLAEEEARKRIEQIKATVAKGLDDTELNLFLYTARMRGLDPLLRQVYAIKRWDAGAQRESMAIQVGIDGYRLMADRTGAYCGNDDAIFEGTTPEGYPALARVTVWKLIAGQRYPFTASARWSEYYPGDKGGFMWRRMPHVMLAKVCEGLALRKAFPAELSGIYTSEEMAQADREEEPSRPSPAPHAPQRHTEGQQTAHKAIDGARELGEAWAEWERLVGIAKSEGRWETISNQTVKGRKFKPPAQDASLGTLQWYIGWLRHEMRPTQDQDAEAF